ncbi:DUF5317 family protein [Eubacterium multiforme]|nr:DUF5317 family protein [Eubacterium multiforme]
MLETIIIALIICKIKGYKIIPLFKNWTIYPVVIMEVINITLQANVFMRNYELIRYAGILKTVYLCSYLPLVFKYKEYISAIVGSIAIVFGGILNDIAIKANNGFMPVFPSLSYLTGYATTESFSKVNDIHILGGDHTNLKFLTDIFDLGYSILSVGDIFIRLYVFLIIYNAVKNINILQSYKKV